MQGLAVLSPVGVERHAQVYSMLPQEAQVLARPCPAQHTEGLLLCRRYDDVNAPHLPCSCAEVAKDVIVPAISTDAMFRAQDSCQDTSSSTLPASQEEAPEPTEC